MSKLTLSDMDAEQLESAYQMAVNPRMIYFLPMGSGKTVTTLTYIKWRGFKRVLVLSTGEIIRSTWPGEIDEWEHLTGLKYEFIFSNKSSKKRKGILFGDANIVGCPVSMLDWLVSVYERKWHLWDLVVIDESTLFKNRSMRWKLIKDLVTKITTRVVLLTGTPVANSFEALWPQCYLVDRGQCLGENITAFRRLYFEPVGKFGWRLRSKETRDEIKNALIGHKVAYVVPEDKTSLPALREIKVPFALSSEQMNEYKVVERELSFEVVNQDTGEIEEQELKNKAVMIMHLQQRTSGAWYYNDMQAWREAGDPDADMIKGVEHRHNKKIALIADMIDVLCGDPLLVSFLFNHEKSRLLDHFGDKIEFYNKKDDTQIKRFQQGKIPVLAAHPVSIGHGLNLQHECCHAVHMTTTNDNEVLRQFNKRIYRRGQKRDVSISYLSARGTVDEDIYKSALNKEKSQQWLLDQLIKSIVKRNFV